MSRSDVQKSGAGGEGSEERGVRASPRAANESSLDYHVEPTVPDGANKPTRRLFIKVSWATAALSYAAPKIAYAGRGGQLSPAAVPLPFHQEFAVDGLEGSFEGSPDVYEFSLSGAFDIDEAGVATVTGLSMQGLLPTGGDPISIEQREDGAGTYAGTRLDVRVPVLFSHQEVRDFPTVLRMQGTLTTVEANVDLSLTVDPGVLEIKGFIPPEP